jgi:hypothetical protein
VSHFHRLRIYAGVPIDASTSLSQDIPGQAVDDRHSHPVDRKTGEIAPYEGHSHICNGQTGDCSETVQVA